MKVETNHFFKSILIIFVTLQITLNCFAQNAAVLSIEKVLDLDTVEEATEFLIKEAKNQNQNCDKRVLYAFLGSVQEQNSKFQEAAESFATAASISVDQETIKSFILKKEATPAEKIVYSMLKKTSSILVLDAVRCSLNEGDSKTALNYLNSSIRNSKDEKIQAKIRLYEIWAKLCQAQTEQELEESITLLKAYSSLKNMESVMPSVLFTLWYINNDENAARTLQKSYPLSPEASIVSGASQLMPTPFWFFVLRKGNALASANDSKANSILQGSIGIQNSQQESTLSSSETEKVKRQQVGLFGKIENAQAMVARLAEKGFKASIEEEKRPSGNIYFIVAVNENEQGTIGIQLKTAGFDCYPIY